MQWEFLSVIAEHSPCPRQPIHEELFPSPQEPWGSRGCAAAVPPLNLAFSRLQEPIPSSSPALPGAPLLNWLQFTQFITGIPKLGTSILSLPVPQVWLNWIMLDPVRDRAWDETDWVYLINLIFWVPEPLKHCSEAVQYSCRFAHIFKLLLILIFSSKNIFRIWPLSMKNFHPLSNLSNPTSR